ncbi:hypothetical protein [Dyadobacter tibetensis]|uniref:hypothetical protein n=1 Tax=Dyadobacter tibetensis TaxID=1211851 RepID=UPI00047270FF|nr:hypothetical protein [Dyadobacter tibetensis]
MPTYLVEIPHSEKVSDCMHVINVFLSSGSHVISKAHWGCKDGVHKLWFIYDFDDKEQALRSIPALMRADATIVELNQFRVEDVRQYAQE